MLPDLYLITYLLFMYTQCTYINVHLYIYLYTTHLYILYICIVYLLFIYALLYACYHISIYLYSCIHNAHILTHTYTYTIYTYSIYIYYIHIGNAVVRPAAVPY